MCMHGVDICVIFFVEVGVVVMVWVVVFVVVVGVVVFVVVVVAVGLVVMGVVEVLGYVGDYRSAWLWWLW